MDLDGDSVASVPSSDDCKTSEDLTPGVSTKCNGMGDSDKNAVTEVNLLSTGTGGVDLNDSDSAINAIDMFLAEKGSNGHEEESDSVVGEKEAESEGNNVEGAGGVSLSEHSTDSSTSVSNRSHDDNTDSNITPSQGDDSSTQPPQVESGDTTQDRECLEKDDLTLTEEEEHEAGTEASSNTEDTEKKDEVDAEPIYASEAMRAFHSIVTAPETEPRDNTEPMSPMDVEMATEVGLVDVSEGHVTEDTAGLSKDTSGDEAMDVTEPSEEIQAVAKQPTEDEEMDIEEAPSDLAGE